MPPVSSADQRGGSGCWRVMNVLILLGLGLLYLAKETPPDEAEPIPMTGGEGSRPSEGEYKVLLSKGAGSLAIQGPDPEGQTTSTGTPLPSNKIRLFPTITQTFRKRGRKKRKVGPEIRLLPLPALDIPKTGLQNISFECPTTHCNSHDCVVVFPVFSSKGLWAWNVYPETGYQRFQVSQRMNGGGFLPSHDVGHSDCNTVIKVKLTRTPLPERVYLVCGDRAYSCMPYDTFDGTCYLAYLIPLIRKVETDEIAAILPSLHRNRRTITTGQQLASAVLPWYGIYVSQQEIIALSKIVENHLNVSNRAMLAEHKELQEVRTVALQNRMALDLLLAAQGGTCKVIGSECCSFISDATPEVMDIAHDTARGIKKLHETHGFAFGDLSGIFGSWGAGLGKLAITISLFILAVLILIMCLVTVVKLVMQKVVKTALQAPQTLVGYDTIDDTVMMYDVELPDPWVSTVAPEPWVPPYNEWPMN
ncbi:uncharacterized protein LOC117537743 [Gymnodraco acuticeps]|uniref:Uncharacterized protein LOC117537743 n=1 Tax=Gymnodraco acuticeps TaxID=8218 RepID=A0A6P8TM07_GYMAC|nr:uncharacterized protein LOC117537743 [Gymnodraco acuticeps]